MTLNHKIAQKVFMRDKYQCRHCKFTDGLHPHHVIFKSQQGEDVLNNLLTMCYQCHRAIHDGKLKIDILEKTEDNLVVKFRRIGGWKPQ